MDLEFSNKLFISQEIDTHVTNADVVDFLKSAIERFPDYFWTIPASREKYHPKDERAPGGLVLHVRRVIKLVDYFVRFHKLNLWEKDVLVAAAVLHDAFARGIPPNVGNTSDELHPMYVSMQFPFNADASRFIDENIYNEIMECVISHSGPFSIHSILHSKRKLPSIFQLVDYLASREGIEVKV